jgi:MFS family permease
MVAPAHRSSPVRPAAAAWALVVLTALNFLNYVDRYVLSAVLPALHEDPGFRGVSEFQFGLLQTSFLLVYMVFSPLGGALGDRVKRKHIVAAGVGIWSLATVWSGAARGYRELLAARALIGFGEAGYAAVAPAIISDLFSKDKRARMLSIFYAATPVGSALGFVVGGLVKNAYGWRHAFWVAGAPGLLFALAALATVEPARGGQDEEEAPDGSATAPLVARAADIARNARWLYVTLGSALFTFTLGGLAFWMPTYLETSRHMANASVVFGLLTVISGTIGTFAGGWLGDRWHQRDRGGYVKLSGLGLLAGAPFLLVAPYLPSLTACLALLFVAELLVFLNTGPVNAALLESVAPRERELAMGMYILAIHLFGDAASPPLLGRLADGLITRGWAPDAARTFAVAATAPPLLLGGSILLVGARAFRR